jgi:hypothetical protein
MFKNYLLNILLLCAFLCTSLSSFASHILGGEISYTCTGVNASGKNEYDVSVTLYYDCSGNPPSTTITAALGSPTNGFDIPITLTGGTPVEVSPLCDLNQSSCNGGTQIGIQKIEYTGSVTAPTQSND